MAVGIKMKMLSYFPSIEVKSILLRKNKLEELLYIVIVWAQGLELILVFVSKLKMEGKVGLT